MASGIDSLKKFKESHYPYQNQNEFIDQLNIAFHKGVKDQTLCNDLAKENTWEKRLDKMLRQI